MGTKLTDQLFFTQLVDTTRPGLEDITVAAAAEDYAACRRIFAAYVRKMLQPDVFFSSQRMVEKPLSNEEEEFQRAEKAVRNIMLSVGVEYDFGDGPVDWYSNHTYNQYKEWTWQLSRHKEWHIMSKVYRRTGDERYAQATARQIKSWIDQAQCPDLPCFGGDTLCWRTIECGIRQGQCWPDVIHAFYNSPAFDDDLITDWCKSVWEHGAHLQMDHCTGNWLIMEMTGLVHIGLLYPCFKKADEWYTYAVNKLEEELAIQVYNDGFQYELSTGYQVVLLVNYAIVMRTLQAYGREVPEKMREYMGKMMMMYVYLMRPDGKVPDINDGHDHEVSKLLSRYMDLAPALPELRWAVSEQAEGAPPAELNHIFADSGLAVLRTGWGKDDTWLFFDGGKFGAGHQHEDKLNLLFHADGMPILTECGIYAYDASPMRKYCLSTRGHNTIRVDGMDQNRRKSFFRAGEMEAKHDLRWRFAQDVDFLCASYNEGYGPEEDKSITHERRVYFVRQATGLKPFAIVVDRLNADTEHDYEVMWHLDTEKIESCGMQLRAGTLNILTSEQPIEKAGLSLCRGQQFPEWQGWYSASGLQNQHRPIWTAQYGLHGQKIRWVTVLYPDGGEACPITKVEACINVEETAICLHLSDGSVYSLDEKDFL